MTIAIAPTKQLLGVSLSTFDYSLTPVPLEQRENPFVDEGWHRFTDEQLARYDRLYEKVEGYNWDQRRHYIEYELLSEVFSLDELTRIWWNRAIQCEIYNEWEKDESKYHILAHIKHSIWWYGHEDDYNLIVGYYDAIRSFDFGLGFRSTLDWARGSYGWSRVARQQNSDIYLDGPFGYLIHDQDGNHVMTIGFAVSRHGVHICQVQLRQAKGNRWLYRLPCHYLDYAIDRIAEAFKGYPVWLVDGDDINRVMRHLHRDTGFPDEIQKRIEAFYDKPLERFRRIQKHRCYEDRYMNFWKLVEK